MYNLLILGFAAWCLANLLVNEYGPFDILSRFRYWVGVRYDENSNPYGKNEIAQALTCIHCTSLWVGAGIALIYWLFPDATIKVALAFALSGIVILIDGIANDN